MRGVRTLRDADNYLVQESLGVFAGSDVCSTPYRIHLREHFMPTSGTPNALGTSQRFMNGGLYDRAGSKVDFAGRPQSGGDVVKDISLPVLCLPLSVDMMSAPVVEGKSLFLGNWMGHYGHFITEFFSRLWGRSQFDQFDRIFVAPFIFGRLREIKKLGFHRALLDSVGVELDRFELLVDPLRFSHITVPEPGWKVNVSANTHLRPLYLDSRNFFQDEQGDVSEKIFLTRMPHPSYKRLNNLEAINRVFAKCGFKVIYPELMDMKTQMLHYASCKVMAALSGTLAHNCLFTQPKTLVVEVGDLRTRRQLLPMQITAVQLSEAEYAHIDYVETSGGVLDVENLYAVLSDLGLT